MQWARWTWLWLLTCGFVGFADHRLARCAEPVGPPSAEARRIHDRALTLDSHVDIAGPQYATEQLDPGVDNPRLKCDLVKMAAGGVDGVFLAAYVPQQACDADGFRRAHDAALGKIVAIRRLTATMYPDRCALATTPDEVERTVAGGKRAIMIGVENGYALGTDLTNVARFRNLGVRYITLCHNGHNQICDSCNPAPKLGDSEAKHRGLSPFGRQVVAEMNRLGVMIDLSHAARSTFRDVIAQSKAPVIASHSGCVAVNDHQRNLTDDELKALAANGGVIQIVACGGFLKMPAPERKKAIDELAKRVGVTERNYPAATPQQREQFERGMAELDRQYPPASLKELVDHIEHAVKVAGVDHVGIGSDFDGGGGVRGFNTHADAPNITAELLRRGHSAEAVTKIWGGNLLRVWRAVQAVADRQQAQVAPPRILGIFGGMGPEATANLYAEIVRLTPARKDQDHIPTLIYSLPQVPDRTTAIRNNDRAIVPFLVEGVSRLEKGGAALIVIPCNTAHYFYDDMQQAVQIPIIHMIRETAAAVVARHPKCKTVGLLATSGTIQSGLYEKELRARGLIVVLPEKTIQEGCVMEAVYGEQGIKAGGDKSHSTELLAQAGQHLESKGAQVLVLGCTEIPLAFDPKRAAVPVVNATQVLAEAAIREYTRPARQPQSDARPTAAPRVTLVSYATEPEKRPRARALGIEVGILPTGKLNAITDVPGVRVGHTTLVRGDNVRTGVTAILPHDGNLFQEKVPGAVFVGNGFGKLMGSTQVDELGEIETPILLTSTLNVPRVADALLDYVLAQPGNETVRSVNPLVAETNDGQLNDIRGRHVGRDEVLAAIQAARGGPVDEGAVGAGTGTIAFGFKGGIGTSSRVVPAKSGGYCVGVLVQANFGGVLTIAGAPVGRELGRYYLADQLGAAADAGPRDTARGSIIMVVATDAPLDARSLKRLASRAMLGLGRTGSSSSNGSGDYVIAFSTAAENRIRRDQPVRVTQVLGNEAMSPLFLAAVEATEEAIYNALFRATTMTGRDGRRVEALPIQRTVDILQRHGAIKARL